MPLVYTLTALGQETLPPDYAAELNPKIAANWQ